MEVDTVPPLTACIHRLWWQHERFVEYTEGSRTLYLSSETPPQADERTLERQKGRKIFTTRVEYTGWGRGEVSGVSIAGTFAYETQARKDAENGWTGTRESGIQDETPVGGKRDIVGMAALLHTVMREDAEQHPLLDEDRRPR